MQHPGFVGLAPRKHNLSLLYYSWELLHGDPPSCNRHVELFFRTFSNKCSFKLSSPRTTTRLPPPTAPTTTDHDYISDDRNDDLDGVNRNHAFDNDFDPHRHA